jgi:uncharacterized protein
MKNCLYAGWVRHRRHLPRRHAFRYRLFMVCLNLGELDTVFRGRWLWSTRFPNIAWFRRADHLGPPEEPLQQSVQQLVQDRLGFRPTGPIFLLTHLRYFGYGFNPVSFYYCLGQEGRHVEAIVAEINNTPWGEQYCYVVDARPSRDRRVHGFQLKKAFHVSPFMPMEQSYDWRFSTPDDTLLVHIRSRQDGQTLFDATLNLQQQTLSSLALARVLIVFPLMTVKVVAAIYWQAFRLWLKRIHFHPHPARTAKEALP